MRPFLCFTIHSFYSVIASAAWQSMYARCGDVVWVAARKSVARNDSGFIHRSSGYNHPKYFYPNTDTEPTKAIKILPVVEQDTDDSMP